MASRKILKKNIHDYAETMKAGILIVANLNPEANLKELWEEVTHLETEAVCRISHTEPGNTKAYYRQLKQQFHEGLATVSDKLQAALPA